MIISTCIDSHFHDIIIIIFKHAAFLAMIALILIRFSAVDDEDEASTERKTLLTSRI